MSRKIITIWKQYENMKSQQFLAVSTLIAPNISTEICRPLSCEWAISQNAHFIKALCIYFFKNTNNYWCWRQSADYNQRFALRNVTSSGQRIPQNERENRFDADRSGRSAAMPKSVGILPGQAHTAVTSFMTFSSE
jgi:hypothetical protein